MNYITFIYAILLLGSTYYGYKKDIGGSIPSIVICLLLSITTILNLIIVNIILKTVITILLVTVSASFLNDRKNSGKTINYSHHIIRLILHLVLIYFLYF